MELITDADYMDELVIFANTSPQAKSLIHRLEQVVRGIDLYLNLN